MSFGNHVNARRFLFRGTVNFKIKVFRSRSSVDPLLVDRRINFYSSDDLLFGLWLNRKTFGYLLGFFYRFLSRLLRTGGRGLSLNSGPRSYSLAAALRAPSLLILLISDGIEAIIKLLLYLQQGSLTNSPRSTPFRTWTAVYLSLFPSIWVSYATPVVLSQVLRTCCSLSSFFFFWFNVCIPTSDLHTSLILFLLVSHYLLPFDWH